MRYYRTGLFESAHLRTDKRYTKLALFDIPRSEVCMVDPAFLIRAMFPLRATQIRRPLPHVVGSPASEYYETI